jgi:hypothetical protein
MANFNEKVNRGIGYILNSQEFFIYRSGTNEEFARKIYNDLHSRKDGYRLVIQYKATHRVKRMAGHCFMWSRESANNGNVEVRMLDRKEDCEGIGDPRLDSIEGAIFIRDRYVYMYGDTWIDAVTLNKECVVCDAFVCGRLGGTFRIPAEVFDRLFGLKENFPEQYEKPVQEKNDLLEEAKRSVELCKNLLYSTKPMIEIAVGLIQDALIDIEDRMRDLDDMLYKLTQKEERREEK